MRPHRPRALRASVGSVLALAAFALVALGASTADATKVERVVSPGGIEAWLVQEKSVPLISVEFVFRGGAIQDPADQAGVANMAAALLDEGAGELDSKAFHERLEEKAIQLGFSAGRDRFRGSLRTLLEHRDDAVELLRLALTVPRFDGDEVERVRGQVLAGVPGGAGGPDEGCRQGGGAARVPRHPFGRPGGGPRLGAA